MSKSSAPAPRSEPAPAAEPATRAPLPRFVGVGYVVAFSAVSIAGLGQAASAPSALVPRAALWPLSLLVALYTLLGTLGVYLVERRGSMGQLRALLGLTAALGAATTLASNGYTSMMLLAVVSASVLHLRLAESALLSVVAALVALLAFALRATVWSAFVQAEVAFGSGMAFVFVFSRIALREQRARTEVERLAADLARANTQLEARADEVGQLATLNERNRIAREIHDGLGHYLTVVHMQLEAAQTLVAVEPERACAALRKAQQLTHEGLNEVRRSVSLLRGEAPARPPLVEALGLLAAECREAGVPTLVRIEGTPRRIAEPVEFTLYRAAQEALTNAHRHAHASRVEIALVFGEAGELSLRVHDDGVGADEPRAGFGLRGLRERAELVGGRIAITSRRDQGFSLELQVPG